MRFSADVEATTWLILWCGVEESIQPYEQPSHYHNQPHNSHIHPNPSLYEFPFPVPGDSATHRKMINSCKRIWNVQSNFLSLEWNHTLFGWGGCYGKLIVEENRMEICLYLKYFIRFSHNAFQKMPALIHNMNVSRFVRSKAQIALNIYAENMYVCSHKSMLR